MPNFSKHSRLTVYMICLEGGAARMQTNQMPRAAGIDDALGPRLRDIMSYCKSSVIRPSDSQVIYAVDLDLLLQQGERVITFNHIELDDKNWPPVL